MQYSFLIAALIGSTISPVFGNPTSPKSKLDIARRDTPVHCTDNESNNPIPGNLVCLDSYGAAMGCDQCLGLNGYSPARRDQGSLCNIINSTSDGLTTNFTPTSCPGDDPPATNPDGTPGSSIGAGIMDAYCAAVGNEGLFGWLSFGACYAYTFAQAGGDDFEAGVILLCDFFTSGLCTCIGSGACSVGGGGASMLRIAGTDSRV